MSLTVRNDEQITVGITPGLVAGSSSFTFDGTNGKPDYRNYIIVPSELGGRGVLINNTEYTWNYETGVLNFLEGFILPNSQVYNIHFQIYYVPLISNVAAIINPTFFVRDINIPNTTDTKLLDTLNSFIRKYEPECLTKLLGYELYKVFKTETSTRMSELLYGTEYTDDAGNLQLWQGLVHDTDVSLIANYIYYFYQEANATRTTGTGTKVSKQEAGFAYSPADKMINAWNFMSREAKECLSFLWIKKIDNVRVYPEFTSTHFWAAKENLKTINYFGF